MKTVIVGGVAGGASAAARLRRLDENAEIVIFERSGYISYANCGLPYYIGGIITDKEELTLQSPQSFKSRFNIDVRVNHEVVKINPDIKTVTVKNLKNGECFDESYDKLILSPGAKAAVPPLDGVDSGKIFTLRTVEDTFKIKNYLNFEKPQTAVVIGAGFIGLEAAENLAETGIKVTLIEFADHVLAPFDYDMACQLHGLIKRRGIDLLLNTAVTAFKEENEKISVFTDKGRKIYADIVIMSVGVTPDTAIAKDAGLKLGVKGSIIVNERMETSCKDIYAVGDAVEVEHYITGKKALVSLAGPANKQGRIAADNICNIKSEYKGSQGSSVLKLFEMTAASTGINETTAKALGLDCESVVLSPASHASYYPGGKIMTMKVVFDKQTDSILGAQIVGYDGVDKRIDVIAAAIRGKIKASALSELELAYAPPYSSAKDPVNMAGFMIENILTGKVKQFSYNDLKSVQSDENAFLLDARTPSEYAGGCAEGFVNIPVDEIRKRISEIPKSKKIYVMCQSGLRSYIACRILTQNGFDCYNFAGGYRFYEMIESEKTACEFTLPCGADGK